MNRVRIIALRYLYLYMDDGSINESDTLVPIATLLLEIARKIITQWPTCSPNPEVFS